MIDDKLSHRINDLYQAFKTYPSRPEMLKPPWGTTEIERRALHSKPLNELDGEDLATYIWKAMTTWGELNDFKHYLPRILELCSTGEWLVDNSLVLNKLNYGEWWTWPSREQSTIISFLLALWEDTLVRRSDFEISYFLELIDFGIPLEKLLKRWPLDIDSMGFRKFVDLVFDHYYSLDGLKGYFRSVDPQNVNALKIWIDSKVDILENGFFFYERIDTNLADKVSIALQLIESRRH